MACFHPWEPSPALGLGPLIKLLPCGQCIGCRLERSRQQAARCIHEAKTHKFNTWATLTYDDEHLPNKYSLGVENPKTRRILYSGSLNKIHVPQFIRATRKALIWGRLPTVANDLLLNTNTLRLKADLRYYYSGEYGEQLRRPHYHICLFGMEFQDKKHLQTTDAGFNLYTSKTLQKLWPYGNHMIGDLNFETAAYTARYIMKKATGQKAEEHYKVINAETGEIIDLIPEFNEASRMPGIGREHYEKYKTDYYKTNTSQINIRGKHTRPPRYYDKQYEKTNPQHYKELKFTRQMETAKNRKKHTTERLKAEETITIAKIKSLKGTL